MGGWGGEDDDMFNRIDNMGLKIMRYSEEISRYTMLKHINEEPNKLRWMLLEQALNRNKLDGLIDLSYSKLDKTLQKLFTNITVQIKMPQHLRELEKKVLSNANNLVSNFLLSCFLILFLSLYI